MSLSVFLIGCAAAAQLNAGLRDEEKATHKAQGRCGPDTQTCGDGEIVHRDPSNICRFATCSGGTSFVEVDRRAGIDGECIYDAAIDQQDPKDPDFGECATVPDDICKDGGDAFYG